MATTGITIGGATASRIGAAELRRGPMPTDGAGISGRGESRQARGQQNGVGVAPLRTTPTRLPPGFRARRAAPRGRCTPAGSGSCPLVRSSDPLHRRCALEKVTTRAAPRHSSAMASGTGATTRDPVDEGVGAGRRTTGPPRRTARSPARGPRPPRPRSTDRARRDPVAAAVPNPCRPARRRCRAVRPRRTARGRKSLHRPRGPGGTAARPRVPSSASMPSRARVPPGVAPVHDQLGAEAAHGGVLVGAVALRTTIMTRSRPPARHTRATGPGCRGSRTRNLRPRALAAGAVAYTSHPAP